MPRQLGEDELPVLDALRLCQQHVDGVGAGVVRDRLGERDRVQAAGELAVELDERVRHHWLPVGGLRSRDRRVDAAARGRVDAQHVGCRGQLEQRRAARGVLACGDRGLDRLRERPRQVRQVGWERILDERETESLEPPARFGRLVEVAPAHVRVDREVDAVRNRGAEA